MKVLHCYRTYFPDTQGGLEEAVRQTCASTSRRGVENRILTLSTNPEPAVLKYPEAEVHRARQDIELASCSMGLQAFKMFRELAQWADIIHYQYPWPFADMVRLSSGHDKPELVTYQSDIVRQRWLGLAYRPLMHSFLAGMSAIVATSPNYAATSSVLQRYAEKVEVIPIGVDESLYPSVDDLLLRQVTEAFGTEFFLFVGVLRQYKGLHVLLDAIEGAPYPVVIAGAGPTELALKQQAQDLGLTNVHFLGHVSNEKKMALLAACRALVLPSCLRSEAFGVSLLEGAMAAKPLVSTELGTGTTYVNINGETGLTVPPNDASALRAAMDRLFRDGDMAAAMGKNARARFVSNFRAEVMGEKYFALYQKLLMSSVGRAV